MLPFRPAWWLPGPHLQTIWASTLRPRPRIATRRERIELPDGDFLDLDWTTGDSGPIVLVLHGLEGSLRSRYASGILRAVHAQGWRGVLMHFRGCSGEPNRLARSYHSGETGDIDYLVRLLRRREADTPLAVIGYSLGGNALLKWLGEQGADAAITAACAVSVPFDLGKAAKRLNGGLSRLYQWVLLRRLRISTRRKFRNMPCPIDIDALNNWRDFHSFDHHVTAPLHGFASADDYYARCSSRAFLHTIRVPTLILHAADDPFMTTDCVPAHAELSDTIELQCTPQGGHVGFVQGTLPWRADYLPEQAIPAFLARFIG